jgi:hypothetical protein
MCSLKLSYREETSLYGLLQMEGKPYIKKRTELLSCRLANQVAVLAGCHWWVACEG